MPNLAQGVDAWWGGGPLGCRPRTRAQSKHPDAAGAMAWIIMFSMAAGGACDAEDRRGGHAEFGTATAGALLWVLLSTSETRRPPPRLTPPHKRATGVGRPAPFP